DALKPDKGVPQRAGNPDGGGGGGGGGGPQAPGGDGIPAVAQLKALRALQQEVNDRTAAFARKHPDVAKLTEDEKTELSGLRKDQDEVAGLLEEITQRGEAAPAQEEKPGGAPSEKKTKPAGPAAERKTPHDQ